MNRRQFFAAIAAGLLLDPAPPAAPPPASDLLAAYGELQFHRDAFAFVSAPCEYRYLPGMNRLDILYGFSRMKSEMCCRIVGFERDRRPFFGPPKPLRLFDPARLPL